jgi:hypothetical protein
MSTAALSCLLLDAAVIWHLSRWSVTPKQYCVRIHYRVTRTARAPFVLCVLQPEDRSGSRLLMATSYVGRFLSPGTSDPCNFFIIESSSMKPLQMVVRTWEICLLHRNTFHMISPEITNFMQMKNRSVYVPTRIKHTHTHTHTLPVTSDCLIIQ